MCLATLIWISLGLAMDAFETSVGQGTSAAENWAPGAEILSGIFLILIGIRIVPEHPWRASGSA